MDLLSLRVMDRMGHKLLSENGRVSLFNARLDVEVEGTCTGNLNMDFPVSMFGIRKKDFGDDIRSIDSGGTDGMMQVMSMKRS